MTELPSTTHTGSSAALFSANGWAIVTDLDGTLLDDSYDLCAAALALNTLARSSFDIRFIALASSKTLPEMLLLAALCEHPPVLIFENGAGWAVPAQFLPEDFSGAWLDAGENVRYGVDIKGVEYQQICRVLAQLRDEQGFSFSGFADIEAAELAELTGLSISGARLARDRRASEPIMWQGTAQELAAFTAALALKGLQIISGGRFLHVSSAHDKANSFSESLRLCAPDAHVLACGDAPNDLKLLRQAHHALVFPGVGRSYVLNVSSTTSHAPAAGGSVWLQSVLTVLGFYQLHTEGQIE